MESHLLPRDPGAGPPLSQASSHFPIEPLPASVLLDHEIARRERLVGRDAALKTGCGELDGYVLLGGFERGCVVGLSAEEAAAGEEDVGLAIGLQTVARLVVGDRTARAMVVTTLPVTALLPKLRRAMVGQTAVTAAAAGTGQGAALQDLQGRVKDCLERVAIARVFDIEGLWEVLAELEDAVSGPPEAPHGAPDGQRSGEAAPGGQAEHRQPKTEIMDSEDEGGLSSPAPSSTPSPPPIAPAMPPATAQESPPSTAPPDIILVTHTSALLNALFTGRDRQAAHDTVLSLSSHLHSLTRSRAHGGPLVMLLNSTTTTATTTATTAAASSLSSAAPNAGNDGAAPGRSTSRPPRPPDPTLRSIFNPPPLTSVTMGPRLPGNVDRAAAAAVAVAAARRNKPSFGLVFSQMLDLHLLCTRVPRGRADAAAEAAALVASPGSAAGAATGDVVSYAWVVEVLLDEMGVYARGPGGEHDWARRRSSREQRWAVVDVDAEGRVVDAVAW